MMPDARCMDDDEYPELKDALADFLAEVIDIPKFQETGNLSIKVHNTYVRRRWFGKYKPAGSFRVRVEKLG